jgi:hypothetical protein
MHVVDVKASSGDDWYPPNSTLPLRADDVRPVTVAVELANLDAADDSTSLVLEVEGPSGYEAFRTEQDVTVQAGGGGSRAEFNIPNAALSDPGRYLLQVYPMSNAADGAGGLDIFREEAGSSGQPESHLGDITVTGGAGDSPIIVTCSALWNSGPTADHTALECWTVGPSGYQTYLTSQAIVVPTGGTAVVPAPFAIPSSAFQTSDYYTAVICLLSTGEWREKRFHLDVNTQTLTADAGA